MPVRRAHHRLGPAGDAGLPAAHAVRLEPLAEMRPVAFIAPEPVATQVARGRCPPACRTRRGAQRGRAALLVAALTARPDALFDATED